MKKRFIVLLDESTKEQDDAFLAWIRDQKAGWWHWLTNSWLITNTRGHLVAKDIRDKVNETYGGVNSIVIELGDDYDTWSGFGPSGKERNMFTWVKDNWHK